MNSPDKISLPLIADLKQLIESSRQRVAVAVNVEITMLYWNIGKQIQQHLLSKIGRAHV